MKLNYWRSNLTYLREKSSKTQTDIAKMLGKTQQTVGGWEKGISQPGIDDLFTLTEYFCISFKELYSKDMRAEAYISPDPGTGYDKTASPEEGILKKMEVIVESQRETILAKGELVTYLKNELNVLQNQIQRLKKELPNLPAWLGNTTISPKENG